jgi:hypothetical protein
VAPVNLSWRDPSAGIAALLVVLVGILLILKDPVPAELWALLPIIAGFLFGAHAALGGVTKGQNGNNGNGNGAATTAPAASSPPPSTLATSRPPEVPPTFGGTNPSAPSGSST